MLHYDEVADYAPRCAHLSKKILAETDDLQD